MGYLDPIIACNRWDPARFRPLVHSGALIGRLRPAVADALRRWPALFRIDSDRCELRDHGAGCRHLTAALAEVVAQLAADGLLPAPLGERYPVVTAFGEPPRLLLDRAAAPGFGIRAFGQHVNGFVRRADGLWMWVGRRSRNRLQAPGRLDNFAAGGLPYGLSLHENLVKECHEEAGVPSELAARARPVGVLGYCREVERGLKRDTLYCYDLELPDGFVPRALDGEMGAFHLWPLAEVARRVREGGEFKLNCNLVVIDFLIRHGHLAPDEPDYAQLVVELHSGLARLERELNSRASGPL